MKLGLNVIMEQRWILNSSVVFLGLIFCQALNSASAEQNAPNITTHPESQRINSTGSNATFTCRVHGNPPPQISWRKDGVEVFPPEETETEGNFTVVSTIYLVNVTLKDAGNYTCFANNSEGNATSLAAEFTFLTDSYNEATNLKVINSTSRLGQNNTGQGRPPNSSVIDTTSSNSSVVDTTSSNSSVEGTSSSSVVDTTSSNSLVEGTSSSSVVDTPANTSAVNTTASSGGGGDGGGGNGEGGGDGGGGNGGGGQNITSNSTIDGASLSPRGPHATSGSNGGVSSTPSFSGGEPSTSSGVKRNEQDTIEKIHKATTVLTIQGNFNIDLNNKSSQIYKKKKQEVDEAVFKTLKESENFTIKVVRRPGDGVVNFTNGSIVANVIIFVNLTATNLPPTVDLSYAIQTALIYANSTNTLGNIILLAKPEVKVTAESTKTTAPTADPSASADEDSGLEGWEIALIVIFIMILIGIIIFVVFMIFYRKQTAESAKELDEYPNGVDHQYAQVNENVYDNIKTDSSAVHDDPV